MQTWKGKPRGRNCLKQRTAKQIEQKKKKLDHHKRESGGEGWGGQCEGQVEGDEIEEAENKIMKKTKEKRKEKSQDK